MNYQETLHKFMRVQQLHGWHISKEITNNDMFHYKHMLIVAFVKDNAGCTQQDIANNFALSRAAVTKTLKKLISNGVIEKETDKNDIRKNVLTITDKGLKILDSTKSIINNVDQLIFKNFTENDLKQFDSYLQRIMENLETDYTRNKCANELFDELKKEKEVE